MISGAKFMVQYPIFACIRPCLVNRSCTISIKLSAPFFPLHFLCMPDSQIKIEDLRQTASSENWAIFSAILALFAHVKDIVIIVKNERQRCFRHPVIYLWQNNALYSQLFHKTMSWHATVFSRTSGQDWKLDETKTPKRRMSIWTQTKKSSIQLGRTCPARCGIQISRHFYDIVFVAQTIAEKYELIRKDVRWLTDEVRWEIDCGIGMNKATLRLLSCNTRTVSGRDVDE